MRAKRAAAPEMHNYVRLVYDAMRLSLPLVQAPNAVPAGAAPTTNGSKIYESPGSAQPLLQKAQPLHLHTPQWFLAFSGLQNGLQA